MTRTAKLPRQKPRPCQENYQHSAGCGIYRDMACDRCLACRLRLAHVHRDALEVARCTWEQLSRRHRFLKAIAPWPDPEPAPDPLTPQQFARVLYTLLHPEYRALARDVLMLLLAEPVAELVHTLRRRR